MEALDCCVDSDKLNGTADELNNECTAVLPSYGPTPVVFNLDDSCYFYQQELAGTQDIVSTAGFSSLFTNLGSFLNNLLGFGGLNPTTTPTQYAAGTASPSVDADKQRRNTLIILGIVSAVVIGFVGYTLYKKSK